MDQIEWAAFTWQAFATLVTGALAVGAATLVAVRQLTIARRQVDIQERQVWLAELTLREKLFERRLTTYNTVRRFLVDTVTRQEAPPSDHWHEFAEAVQATRFLFAAQVYEKLIEIYEETTDLWMALGTLEDDPHRPWFTAAAQASAESLLSRLNQKIGTFAEIFGDEIYLAGDPSNRPDVTRAIAAARQHWDRKWLRRVKSKLSSLPEVP